MDFNRGKAFYAAQNFEDALAAFRASVATYPSPTAQLLVARCLRELGRLGEAVLAYEDAVVLAGTRAALSEEYAQARGAAESELGELAARVGRLRIELVPADVKAEVRVGGLVLPAAASSRAWPVTPGSVVVTASAPGLVAATQTVTVRAAEEARARIEFTAAAGSTRPQDGAPSTAGPTVDEGGGAYDVLAWTSAGIAVLGAGAFVLFYALAQGQQDDYDSACVKSACTDSEQSSLASTGQTYETLTNVGLAAGLVGVVAASVFFVLSATDDASNVGANDPTVRVTTRGMELSWEF